MHREFFKRSIVSSLVCTIFGFHSYSVQGSESGNINLDAINAASAYDKGFTGQGVRIGIFDSGFDVAHSAFVGKDIVNLLSKEYEQIYGTDPKWEEHNHGTHVAGIAAGSDNVDFGVAKDASLLLMSSTLYAQHSMSEPAQLYQMAFESYDEVKIYSNSWGWVRGVSEYHDIPLETEEFKSIFTSAVEKDKLLVFAAGNQAGFAPGDPILSQMRDPTKNGHVLNVVNIESEHLFEEGKFIHGNIGSSIEGSNMGLFAALWTIAAPGTNIVSASAGTADGTLSLTGTSMAAPHVSGALALVQQAFPWMSASQLADTVLSTAQKPKEGSYDVIAYQPNVVSQTNADLKWQHNGAQTFFVASPNYSIEDDCYETNVYNEDAAIVFWGSAGSSLNDIQKLKEQAAERITNKWMEGKLIDLEFQIDPEEYVEALNKAVKEWTDYFIEHCIVVEYGIGAGLLDAGKAVGGIAELNVNRMARWDEGAEKWTFELNNTGLSTGEQLAYKLNLSGDGISRFTNDIVEVAWDPVQHITTEDEFEAYNKKLQENQAYEGSSPQTIKPENADLPVSLVVSGTLNDKGELVSAGTLVMSGNALYRGSTDVINSATLIVNGRINGAVYSDASSTVGGTGSVGSLISKGTLSPGDDTDEGTRLGSLTIDGELRLEAGSSLVLDVSEDLIDQILVKSSAQTVQDSTKMLERIDEALSLQSEDGSGEALKIIIRTGGYIDHQLSIAPIAFFPLLNEGDELLEQLKLADVSWGGGITFDFDIDENGFYTLHRVEDGMQKVARTVALSETALRRARRLDEAIAADGILTGAASKLVGWMDSASENLMSASSEEEKKLTAQQIAETYAAIEPGTHLAFDAAALSRSVRLREVSSLAPLTDVRSSDLIPEAVLSIEHSSMNKGSLEYQSNRTILSAGAKRGFGDWALGWRLGAFYDDIDAQAQDNASASGLFAAASFVREFGQGFRVFGDAALGFTREERTRAVSGLGESSRFEKTVHMVNFGASLGIGQKFRSDLLALDWMPYARLSWDGVEREGFREENTEMALGFRNELLSSTAAEIGLALSSRSFSTDGADGLSIEARAAYRNRFLTIGDENYEWAGIEDKTYLNFLDNRHAFVLQCALGWRMTSGHEISLAIDAEAGDSNAQRWGAALRWVRRF